jgi:hypothetical protein
VGATPTTSAPFRRAPNFEVSGMDTRAAAAGYPKLRSSHHLSTIASAPESPTTTTQQSISPGSDLSYRYSSELPIKPVPVHWESQTTPATKLAAVAHRKPGSVAKYVCHYCKESFTRVFFLLFYFSFCLTLFLLMRSRSRHRHIT